MLERAVRVSGARVQGWAWRPRVQAARITVLWLCFDRGLCAHKPLSASASLVARACGSGFGAQALALGF